jgi:hypothetical protein
LEERLRRDLKLNSFKDIEDELDKIEKATELRTVGVWSVYQILQHMTDMLHGSMHGFPKLQFKLFRMTIGKFIYNSIINSGEMKAGYPNPSAPSKREEAPILPAVQRLRAMLSEFQSYSGQMAIHPMFDDLNKDQWTKLHLIHFSLHLSFINHVEPKSNQESPSPTEEKAQSKEDGFLYEEKVIMEQMNSDKEESSPSSPELQTNSIPEVISEDEPNEPPIEDKKEPEANSTPVAKKTVSKKKSVVTPSPEPKLVSKKKEALPKTSVGKKKEPVAKKKTPPSKKKPVTKKK